MLIREHMTPNPITVDEGTTVMRAAELMKEKKVRRFPVVRDGALIGIVTDRDLRSAAPSQVVSFDTAERELMPELHALLSKITVKDIMSHKVITVGLEQTIAAAAQFMLRHRVSGLPVVDAGGKLAGIITESDIFKVLVDLSGTSLGNAVVALRLKDHPGSIKEAADTIREHGGRLASILTSYNAQDPQFRRVYIRIGGIDAEQLQALEQALRREFEVLYLVLDGISSR